MKRLIVTLALLATLVPARDKPLEAVSLYHNYKTVIAEAWRCVRLAISFALGGLYLSTSAGADTFACAAIDDRAARLQCFTAVEEITATVGRIVDGDTMDICIGASCIRVRLCGIDTPERGEPGADEATEALRRLVSRETVRCLPVGLGTVCDGRSRSTNHGRLVAQCFINGTDIGGAMVERGLACDLERFTGGHYGRAVSGRAC